MYDFMKETVVMTAFMCIIGLDVVAIVYWIARFVKWVKKTRAKGETESE